MNNQHDRENLTPENERSLQTLVRAITLSQGDFSLILLRCNYADLRRRITQILHEVSPVEIREITLPASVKTLYTTIAEQLGDEQPPALMVFGLEAVQDIDTVLTAANRVREEFRNNFHFPILLWINDQVLQKLIRLATDLESWTTTVLFENSNHELIKVIKQITEEIFNSSLIPQAQVCWELEKARQDLQSRGVELEPELQASFAFARCWQNYLYDNLDAALEDYQQSLNYWEKSNNLERQGVLLFHMGWACEQQAQKNQGSLPEARKYLEAAITVLEKGKYKNLVAKYINKLGEVLRSLQAWNELQRLAEKALHLHQTHNFVLQLAQCYGFLAEVALEKLRWNEAQDFAQKALEISRDISNQPVDEYGLYWLLLARAQYGLQQVYQAINNLELAREKSNHQYNPKLYIRILETLRGWYFDEKEYLKAFRLKLEQLQIEQQYGFRAFVGASYLNPQRQVITTTKFSGEKTGTIADEIRSSGRELDVIKLRDKISRDQNKLIVIHGQSGVGKSSILQAGLIPALQQQPVKERDALPVLVRVYSDWVGVLGRKLIEAFEAVRGHKLEVNLNSVATIIDQLRQNNEYNFLTVLIFDQFEEFFFAYSDKTQRSEFYQFLQICLDLPFVKVVLSLREDYLHYLLELERLFDLGVVNNNILDKDIRYYLGNFSLEDTKKVIQSLTERTQFYLEPALLEQLVSDLAKQLGEVRPIELQIVGTQLQTERIITLEEYLQLGTKEKLVERFLEDVIKDCGAENKQAAQLVLYLLTDENGTRPLKTHAELAADLTAEVDKLNLVLEIFVQSGLVLLLPESPADRYQLVHDYLVDFIRQQQGNEILAELEREREQRKRTEQELEQAEARLAQVNADLEKQRVALKEAQEGTRLERESIAALRQFEYAELEALVSVIHSARELKALVQDGRPLEKYPSVSPIFALNTILNKIKERNQIKGHYGRVYGVSFSPDGKTILTAFDDNIVRLWTLNGQLLQEFKGHQDRVNTVSFSPDGQTIATASSDNTARLWTLHGQLLKEFKGHQGRVWAVSFSPDGKTIATASDDRTARLWTLNGQLLQKFLGHQGRVYSVSFSPNGKIIATASSDNTARLWTLAGQLLQEFQGHQSRVNTVVFSPDGKTIATSSSDNTARLWMLNGQLLQKFKGHQGWVNSVSFSPDGKTIATTSDDKTARLWTLNGQLLQEFKGHQGSVNSVSFSPDGKTIATASLDNTVRLWTLNEQLFKPFQGHRGEIKNVSFSPDGKNIATASSDKTARLWTLSGQLLQEFKGHQGWVNSVSFSPDGKTIATASSDKTVRLWTLSGQLLQEFKGHQGWVNSVCFSPDGKTIATACSDKIVRLWTLAGQLLQEFKAHRDWLNSISFSFDSQTIVTASLDKTARLWTPDGQLLQEFKGHQGGVYGVSFSPDGQTIATASSDKTARLWTPDGQLLQEFKGHQGGVYGVSFTPDGQIIATASSDNTARLWTLDGQLLHELKGHQGRIWAVSFSPDGKIIATASDDKKARLWHVQNLDDLLLRGYKWLKYYVKNPSASEKERKLCEVIK
jgi:WD40 repeat protein/tetratricopeptide (TPR) repeat protein